MGEERLEDVEYEWLVDDEWMGSTSDPRETLRYVEQYREDGDVRIRRVERYSMTEAELHDLVAPTTTGV